MKRLVPNQQFQEAPTVAPHILLSDGGKNYQHALATTITDPIIAAVNVVKLAVDAVKAEAKTAVKDVMYTDHVLTQAEVDANSFTFRLTPRVPLTSPVEVTVADSNGQIGIVVAHTITGFGPAATATNSFGAYDVTVTGFTEELAVGGSLGILTTWKNTVVTTNPTTGNSPVVPN
jgi:hypothetical protein